MEKAEEEWTSFDEKGQAGTIAEGSEKVKQLNEYRFGIDWEEIFLNEAVKHPSPYPMDWYSEEDVLSFVKEHMFSEWTWKGYRFDTEEEKSVHQSSRTDLYLADLNIKYPETWNYYRFPEKWENNGIAAQIHEHFHVPANPMPIDDDLDEDDEL